jgi:hypothetical protein
MPTAQPVLPSPLTVLVDDARGFRDKRPALVARSSQEALDLLNELRDERVDDLWLDHDLVGEDTIRPVVEQLVRLVRTSVMPPVRRSGYLDGKQVASVGGRRQPVTGSRDRSRSWDARPVVSGRSRRPGPGFRPSAHRRSPRRLNLVWSDAAVLVRGVLVR